MIQKYGKSMADILAIKQNFFKNNDNLLLNNNDIAKLYSERPRRLHCKLCNMPLPSEIYFTSHNLEYYLCNCCGHINGKYIDDHIFTDAMYIGAKYGEQYKEPNINEYIKRVDSIYIPKVHFLTNTFDSLNIEYKSYKYLDVGAGSGYMVSALKKNDLLVNGIEVSDSQVIYGNKMLEFITGEKDKNRLLKTIEPENILNIISTADCDVVSFIGVLEHIYNLNEILNAIKINKNIKYLFFCVPMFSLSCIIEIAFPNVFNRHLGSGHTHLFSRESLEWMYSHYNFVKIAAWDFGTDIMDLYRSLVVTLTHNNANKELIERIHNLFQENTDTLQMVIDKAHFCSETHIIVQVNH